MADRRYTEDHEWIDVEGDVGTVGISDYAQEQLGDVVFVELPPVGKSIGQGEEIAVVESVKAAAEVYAPAGGEVTEVNEVLTDDPSLVNTDAFGEGWFVRLKISDPSDLDELMDEDAYAEFTKGLA